MRVDEPRHHPRAAQVDPPRRGRSTTASSTPTTRPRHTPMAEAVGWAGSMVSARTPVISKSSTRPG
ncbi:hypothetical protein ACFQV2_23035 [Actinokineospora soli]|uniref:Uncharacterized protein n=1 Tax=Actinokineospora soli TaxID=1048753 RepID=A0ABW2TQ52_9PSEU